MRINKFLANAGVCSRRQADELIKQKKVKINDKIAILGDNILESDSVFVNGKKIETQNRKIYLAFHKPVGVICTADKSAKNNIIDYINYPERIYPVGRLDVATSGLIVLTNDGEIVNQILKGEHKIEKIYEVVVDKTIDEKFISKLESGLYIDGIKTKPAKIEKIKDKDFYITIVEGKKRQIRRMCEKCGYNVVKLKRIRVGKLELGNLKSGEYREIEKNEIL
ncbi:MAG: 23S rRNA pseudouridine synthase [Candidatus Berkelbacteria bacterium Licking1014_85]|uniref:Pseudouridine synthase n=1 Tax=Candidatus Berkelbacteria bacterium Licking1014_85 TaxID=2017148 RepID=A0A554LM11_9BACT|nr:MAG: 23S rRNA pseudouridine synthase [Candidatus Berkelbacteria bacterium Licking1014_85]